MLGAREVQPLVHVPFQFVNSHDRDPDQIMIDHSIQIISRQDRPYRNRIIALRWLSNTRVVLRLHLRAASEMKCEENFYSELECIILIYMYSPLWLAMVEKGNCRSKKLSVEASVYLREQPKIAGPQSHPALSRGEDSRHAIWVCIALLAALSCIARDGMRELRTYAHQNKIQCAHHSVRREHRPIQRMIGTQDYLPQLSRGQ